MKSIKHTPDETHLILAALVSYRQQYIVALATAENATDNDKSLLQSQIDNVNNLLAKYGY